MRKRTPSAFSPVTHCPMSGARTAQGPDNFELGGQRLGPWKLERPIGSGGMGQVWLARRDDGLYEGDVAIKMLRVAVADSGANQRFAREGQFLARLTHPHIARLLDAGFTAAGQRYLVLEYVIGERLDRWCDERKLSIDARIDLFLQVCSAVSHAHANLVVHRDLKPSNILVQDDEQAKLLDFGVAKLLDATQDDAATQLTALAGAALTPEYAAPEQLSGAPITIATDVYSLGVVLYGLLVGGHRMETMASRRCSVRATSSTPSPCVFRRVSRRPVTLPRPSPSSVRRHPSGFAGTCRGISRPSSARR